MEFRRLIPRLTSTTVSLAVGITVAVTGKWFQVESIGDTARKIDFNLIFGRDSTMQDKVSGIFEEQYPKGAVKYDGYRFGIRMDKNEAGLYDYFANQLTAKYVYDFAPNSNYFDSTANKFAIHFELGLLDGLIPSEEDFRVLK